MYREAEATRLRQFRRHEHVAHKDDAQTAILQIEEGWACSYCLLPDGRRQITGLFLPGDYCEPHWLLSGKADLPIVALTSVTAKAIPIAGVHSKPGDGVMKLLGAVLETHRRQVSWIIGLGRKTALERVGDLLMALHRRMAALDRVVDGRCTIPLTQQDIADVVGLTPVHVNRVLGDLRNRGLLRFSGKTLHILQPAALDRLAHDTYSAPEDAPRRTVAAA